MRHEMNCTNYTDQPNKPRNYLSPCNTSILRLDLEASVGRTHRYVKDPSTYVSHAFGYGLSYTSFKYVAFSAPSAIALASNNAINTDTTNLTTNPKNITLEVQVKNTGGMDGAEIVQIYMEGATIPNVPTAIQNLIGFAKVDINQGSTMMVQIPIDDDRWKTAQADGSASVIPGTYILWACGHQPHDQEGTVGTSGACLNTSIKL